MSECAPEARAAIVRSATLIRMEAGQMLCHEGQLDRYCVYLIKGSVETLSGGQRVKRIDAETPIALHPLAEDQPRTLSVRSITAVGLLRVPRIAMRTVAEQAYAEAQAPSNDTGISLSELDSDDNSADDWMTMLLRSPLYSQLPVTNIQRIMASMESVTLLRGDAIVRQGDPGDYFYFLSKGKARVIRQVRDGEPPVMLAELAPGVSFGEEALVAGLPRNATVSMLTDGRVMRLSKAHFEDLILEPTLSRLSWLEASRRVHNGARWLDVRTPDEFQRDGLDRALNVPLGMLRMRIAKLDRDAEYVVYCDDGRRSAAGAFLMVCAGFTVQMLDGGITTPEGIDTIDRKLRAPEPPAPSTNEFGFETVRAEHRRTPRRMPHQAPAAPGAVAENTTAITSQLRDKLLESERARETAERRGDAAEAELRAAQEALRNERERARDLAKDMQFLRQTLTDIQRQAHDALMRERTAYEQELTQAVENLEQALLEKEMALEVERAKNQQEVAHLRRLLEAADNVAG